MIFNNMNLLIESLRNNRNIRNAEHKEMNTKEELRYQMENLKELQEQRVECIETIVKNLNMMTGHKHTISKVVHESEQYTGMPISNMHHRQAMDFLTDVVNLLNDKNAMNNHNNSKDGIDACRLSMDVESCTQSTADRFKAFKSCIDKAEALIHNVQVIGDDEYSDEDQGLETSIFDE